MPSFHFTVYAQRMFQKIDGETQRRITSKLKELKEHPSIMTILEPLRDMEPATHRLRIGNYRLLLSIENDAFIVLKIAHRREVYR